MQYHVWWERRKFHFGRSRSTYQGWNDLQASGETHLPWVCGWVHVGVNGIEYIVCNLFSFPDPTFVRTFLMTYRSFSKPSELLELLIFRYQIPNPAESEDMEAKRDPNMMKALKQCKDNYIYPIQLRCAISFFWLFLPMVSTRNYMHPSKRWLYTRRGWANINIVWTQGTYILYGGCFSCLSVCLFLSARVCSRYTHVFSCVLVL